MGLQNGSQPPCSRFQGQWWTVNLSRSKKGFVGLDDLPTLPKKGVGDLVLSSYPLTYRNRGPEMYGVEVES